jgi:hypothetical protein
MKYCLLDRKEQKVQRTISTWTSVRVAVSQPELRFIFILPGQGGGAAHLSNVGRYRLPYRTE